MFHLFKDRRDTMEALNILKQVLRYNIRATLIEYSVPKVAAFKFSGNKDRRAVTVQRVTVDNMTPLKLLKANESLYSNIKVSSPQ